MKARYIVLLTILGVTASIILHFSSTMLYIIVSNYENLTKYELAGLPLFFLSATIITLMIYLYRYLKLGRTNGYTKRLYSILIMVFSALGLASSIFVGTFVYGSLFTRYVFIAYPFIMLLANTCLLVAGIYYLIIANKDIKENPEKPAKSSIKHIFYTIGISILILLAFVRVGSLFLLPMLYSPYDGFYVIPFYVQYLGPIAVLACFLYWRDFAKEENKHKFATISTSIIAGVSLLTLIYMVFVAKLYYPNIINAISNSVFLERLITFPVFFVTLYLISILPAICNLIIMLIRKIKKAK